jgi:3-hydroxyisobutyrate dehydrogenase
MAKKQENPAIGFIGIGVMGRSMAGHLLAAGYPLHVFTRTKAKCEDLLAKGAVWHDTVADLARQCRVIITMVGFPSDVELVYLGDKGIIDNAPKGACLIDMTTSSPALAIRINNEAAGKGLKALDAPVSGGDVGAREARLSIMVGGDKLAFEEMLPIMQVMGKNVVYQGPAGSGQHTKLANQIVIAGNMMGACEALAYAKRAGLDPTKVLQSIGAGAAHSWSLVNLGPKMMAGDFQPGFFVKHFIKDMKIALESAKILGLDTPGLRTAEGLYEDLAAKGGADLGTQALYKVYE